MGGYGPGFGMMGGFGGGGTTSSLRDRLIDINPALLI